MCSNLKSTLNELCMAVRLADKAIYYNARFQLQLADYKVIFSAALLYIPKKRGYFDTRPSISWVM